MTHQLRWGVLGTGNIARQFVQGLATCPSAKVEAVGSRQPSSAKAFANTHNIERAYGGYQELIEDPAIDAIYNALPNNLHHHWTIQALSAGKHVLCEKPLAMNSEEAREMFAAARANGRVLVEAFMYRSHPLTHAVYEAVKSGRIGELLVIRTSFCYRTNRLENIRFDPKLGGGGLMDVGCYCLSFSRLFAGGEPSEIAAHGRFHRTGVDEAVTASMRFNNSVLATFTCGMSVQADNTAHLLGTDGYIELPVPWKPPKTGAKWVLGYSTPPKMDLAAGMAAPPRQTFEVDAPRELYGLEAADFAATVFDGRPPAVSETDTLGNMAALDEIRRQIERQRCS